MSSPAEHAGPGPDTAHASPDGARGTHIPPQHPAPSAPPAGATPPYGTPPPGCPLHDMDVNTLARMWGPGHDEDPHSLYERLREEHGPVAPVRLDGDLPAWLLLGYRENLEAMRNPSRFSRNSRLWRDRLEGRVAADNPLNPITTWQPVTVFTDGVEHERFRSAISDSIGRFDHRGMRRWIKVYTNELVDNFCSAGSADAVTEFAEHLPMMVILKLLGCPEAYSPRMVQAARDLTTGSPSAIASNEYVMNVFYDLVARKHSAPDRDFTSWLLEHKSRLSDEEVAQHLRLVLIAAFEATANLISNTLRMVLTDPRFRANLAGGHMTLPDAVEQLLWDEPPFMTLLGRWAASDSVLAGRQIKKGDVVLLGLAGGNWDPSARPDPDVPVRGNRSHLAFSGGEHECPGQDIGRSMAAASIEALLDRLPDLRMACDESELRFSVALMSRHLESLPVVFTPAAPQGPDEDDAPIAPGLTEDGTLPLREDGTSVADPPAAPPVPAESAPPAGGFRRWWRGFRAWLGGTPRQ